MKISDIDKNLKISTEQSENGLVFYNPEEEPFKLYGIFRDGGAFCRMPGSLAESISGSVAYLNENTAGGRVRFKTDSRRVILKVELTDVCNMPHMTCCGSSGFDMYEKTKNGFKYVHSFIPATDHGVSYTAEMQFSEYKERDLVINFPLYSGVKKVLIGLDEGTNVSKGSAYAHAKPIVYYGSSITQGGCASKPGSAYQAILSAQLDTDFVNLGFSGNAKGETAMAEYIAQQEMSLFVMAYDHNAPTAEHLQKTHKSFFDIVRKKNPFLPIILLTRPAYDLTEEETERERIIKSTYKAARDSGDKNVYFLNGKSLMYLTEDNGTVDGCHPTDSGFLSIAKALKPVMEAVLNKQSESGNRQTYIK